MFLTEEIEPVLFVGYRNSMCTQLEWLDDIEFNCWNGESLDVDVVVTRLARGPSGMELSVITFW